MPQVISPEFFGSSNKPPITFPATIPICHSIDCNAMADGCSSSGHNSEINVFVTIAKGVNTPSKNLDESAHQKFGENPKSNENIVIEAIPISITGRLPQWSHIAPQNADVIVLPNIKEKVMRPTQAPVEDLSSAISNFMTILLAKGITKVKTIAFAK
ncbi:unnamed protein product [Blepharisma stoltei]|uniref:Uncharacterized protein n=1 Tax=Blepharisma stoltei TaxID=1481888 RepID=A0AAU9JZ69_9CILI|nr:unnamed protein product [Blepharisma stoltei]